MKETHPVKTFAGFLLILVVFVSAASSAGELKVEIDASSCLSGINGWDKWDERQKTAQLNRLSVCTSRLGRAAADRAWNEALRQINTFNRRAKNGARLQINENAATERSLNNSRNQVAMAKSTAKYDAEMSELKAGYSQENHQQFNEAMAELSARRSAEYTQLQADRRAEEKDLRKRARESVAIVNAKVDDLSTEAKSSVAAQHKEIVNAVVQNSEALNESFKQGVSIADIEKLQPDGASLELATDGEPVGFVQQISEGGAVTITRTNGVTERGSVSTPIFMGDRIETDENTSLNIEFIDNSSFAVSENARLDVDEYIYDPEPESGTAKFSILRGVFVFTSGLIGRDDPDDVTVDTPVGSIGIRG